MLCLLCWLPCVGKSPEINETSVFWEVTAPFLFHITLKQKKKNSKSFNISRMVHCNRRNWAFLVSACTIIPLVAVRTVMQFVAYVRPLSYEQLTKMVVIKCKNVKLHNWTKYRTSVLRTNQLKPKQSVQKMKIFIMAITCGKMCLPYLMSWAKEGGPTDHWVMVFILF